MIRMYVNRKTKINKEFAQVLKRLYSYSNFGTKTVIIVGT